MPNTTTIGELTLLQRLGYIAGCLIFVAAGVFLIFAGSWFGWVGVAVFGYFTYRYVFNPKRAKSIPAKEYRVVITDDLVQCEYPQRESRSMRWDDVARVMLATTSDGPWLPDRWLIFVDANAVEMPIPSEAEGFERFFEVLKSELPGFDFEPFLAAQADDALYECWNRNAA